MRRDHMSITRLCDRRFLALCLFVLSIGCTRKPQSISLVLDLPLSGDAAVEVVNAKTGKLLAADTMVDGKVQMDIDSVFPMVYLVNVSWHRDIVSPTEMRLMNKYQNEELPAYQLQHFLYLSPSEQTRYRLRLNSTASQQEIERAYREQDPGIRLVLDEATGQNVQLQEDMENLYFRAKQDFFHKKDSLHQLMYRYIDESDKKQAAVVHQQLASLWEHNMLPWLTREQDAFVMAHPDSPISAYIIYNRVFNVKDFETYRHLYDKLTPVAKNNHFGHELMHYEKRLKEGIK